MSSPDLRALRRILAYAKPHQGRLVLFAFASVLMIGVNLLQPWPMKILVDNVIGGRPLPDAFGLSAPPPPPDLPSDFPRFPGARYVGPQQLAGVINDHRFDRLWYETDMRGAEVTAWFRQNLTGDYKPLAVINTGYGERYQLDPNRRVVAAEVFVDPRQATVFSLDYIPALNSLDVGDARPDRLLILTGVALATLALFVFSSLLGIWSTALDLSIGQRMLVQLRADLFAHLQALSLLFHESHPLGDTLYRVTDDAYAAQSLLFGGIIPLLTSLATLGAMLVILLSLDWVLTLVALLVLPFLYLSLRYYVARIAPDAERVKELEGGITSMAGEVLGAIRLVQAFARESHEQRRFERQVEQSARARMALTMQETRFHYLVDFATVAGTAVVLWLGGYHILQGQLTVGELLVFLGYLAAVYAPLNSISGTLTVMQESMASARRLCEVFDTQADVREVPHAQLLTRVRGSVRFEHVTFAYREGREALCDVSFETVPGDVVGIVGLSGAGKTTLVSLLLRLFDPESGCISIDGQDIRSVQLRSLREQISIVTQEPILFATSARDNIAYGRLEATDAEIETAARQSGAHEFIGQLPDGYRTHLGEQGAHLSMGQRQRVAIARAFLKNAPILILDEPTAAMDAQNEAALLDALDQLMTGRTTFIVAHRFSTIRRANKILVLEDGRVVEWGSPDVLRAQRGRYQQLYELQMGEPIPAA